MQGEPCKHLHAKVAATLGQVWVRARVGLVDRSAGIPCRRSIHPVSSLYCLVPWSLHVVPGTARLLSFLRDYMRPGPGRVKDAVLLQIRADDHTRRRRRRGERPGGRKAWRRQRGCRKITQSHKTKQNAARPSDWPLLVRLVDSFGPDKSPQKGRQELLTKQFPLPRDDQVSCQVVC